MSYTVSMIGMAGRLKRYAGGIAGRRRGTVAAIAVLGMLLMSVNADAAIIMSAQSGNWSSTKTWTGGVVPGNGDFAVIGTSTAGHTVTIDQNIGTVAGGGIKNIHINNASSVLRYSGDAPRTICFASTGTNPVSTGTGSSYAAPYGKSVFAYDMNMFGIFVTSGKLDLQGTSNNHLTITTADGVSPTFINHDYAAYTQWSGKSWVSVRTGASVTLRYVDITSLGTNFDHYNGMYVDLNVKGTITIDNCTVAKCYNLLKTYGMTAGSGFNVSNNTITNFASDIIVTSTDVPSAVIENNTVTSPDYVRDETSPIAYSVYGKPFYYLAGTIPYLIKANNGSVGPTNWSIKNNVVKGAPVPSGKKWALKVGLFSLTGTGINLTGELTGNRLINYESNSRDNASSYLAKIYLPVTSFLISDNYAVGCFQSIGMSTGTTAAQVGIKIYNNYFEAFADSWFSQGIILFTSGPQEMDIYNNVFVLGSKAHSAMIIFPYSNANNGVTKNITMRNNTFFNRNIRAAWAASLSDTGIYAIYTGDNGSSDTTIGPTHNMALYNNIFKGFDLTVNDSHEDDTWARNPAYGNSGIYRNAATSYKVLSGYKPIWFTTKRGAGPAYVSVNQFSVSSAGYTFKDLSKTVYPAGRRVRFNGSAYGTVLSAAYDASSVTTAVTLAMDAGQAVPITITEVATSTGAYNDSGTDHPNSVYGDILLPSLAFVNEGGSSFSDFAPINNELKGTGVGGVDIGAVPVEASIPALSVVTASLSPAQVNVACAQSLTATGGVPPYTWSRNSGSLPAGLTLDSSGAISGTPTAAGTATFTVQVADNNGQTALQTLSITVLAPPQISSPAQLPDGVVKTAYSQTLAATGGSSPYTWTILSGALPPGLSFTSAGVISGTPSSVGSASFTARVSDTAGLTASRTFTLTVNDPLIITTASPLQVGVTDSAYSQTLTATGGTPPYAWNVISGNLPDGLTYSSGGVISGTPSATGTAGVTFQVTDSNNQTASKAFTITISAPLNISTPTPLPDGYTGNTYNQTLSASGGTAPYTWALVSGNLPTGLGYTAAGVLSGIPSSIGAAGFTMQVTDKNGLTAVRTFTIYVNETLGILSGSLPVGITDSAYNKQLQATGGTSPYLWALKSGTLPKDISLTSDGLISGTPPDVGTSNFTVQVTDNKGQTASRDFSIIVSLPLIIQTPALQDGTVNTPYNQALSATGGTLPYSWTASGALPAGLTLSLDGVVSGTPSSVATAGFTVQVSDKNGVTVNQPFSITVNPGILSVTTAALPDGVSGTPYSQTLSATGGTLPYVWTRVSGNLPASLTLSGDGTISGTPSIAESAVFTVQVTDSNNQTDIKTLTINITSTPANKTNYALADNGGVATASSSQNVYYPVTAVNDGDRSSIKWRAGGVWRDGTNSAWPDWVQIVFSGGTKTISEVDVITVSDLLGTTADTAPPTDVMTFAKYGITAFDVQYCPSGATCTPTSGWVTVPNGSITGNNLVWRKVTFPSVTTDRIRINVKAAIAVNSLIAEIEAY